MFRCGEADFPSEFMQRYRGITGNVDDVEKMM